MRNITHSLGGDKR